MLESVARWATSSSDLMAMLFFEEEKKSIFLLSIFVQPTGASAVFISYFRS